jgi:uncharacterized protein YqfB (UPF0267 family)
MGLYNFRSRFTSSILNGSKTHTIRANRVRSDKPGNIMYLYTGLRQKGAQLLMRAPCVRVEPIYIDAQQQIFLRGEPLSSDECEALALRDGFSSFADMMTFWDGRLPFHGQVYYWDPDKRLS